MNDTPSHRSRTRVLLLSDASVLDLTIEGLLGQNVIMEVVAPELNLDDTLHRIRTFAPDVIVANEARQRRDAALLFQHIVDDMPGVRLITLNTTETSISIYEGGTYAIRAAADLLDAVQLAAL